MAKMTYKEFVKARMKDVSGAPKEKMAKIAMMWSTYKAKGGDLASDDARQDAYAKYLDTQGIKRDYMTDTEWKADAIKRGDIKAGQTDAKSFKDLLDIPSAAKAPQLQYDKQATMEQVAKAEKKQAKVKNIWAPYNAPIVMPVPDGYSWFLFQHPNKFSANPNQVMVAATQSRFLKSSIYNNLKSKLKYVPAKTSGYGAMAPEAKIQPHKDFRILFLFNSPDKDEYLYDAKDVDDYMKVLDMCKDSGFIYPVEVLSKQVMEKNAQLAQAISQQSSDLADYAWNAGAQATQDSWEQSVSKAETQAEAQEQYFNTLKEQEAAQERKASKKSGWDDFLDVAGDVVKVAAKVLI